jgi:hypothetical protein
MQITPQHEQERLYITFILKRTCSEHLAQSFRHQRQYAIVTEEEVKPKATHYSIWCQSNTPNSVPSTQLSPIIVPCVLFAQFLQANYFREAWDWFV